MITLFSAFVLLLHVPAPVANRPARHFISRVVSFPPVVMETPIVDTPAVDSSSSMNDSIQFNFNKGGFHVGKRKHTYIQTGISDGRQIPYNENFSFIDFNRVTGLFLGLGTPGMIDLGRHDEVGLEASGGYGFASKRWEDRFGGEFRLPLAETRGWKEDTSFKHRMRGVPTIAIGGEVHNITSTDDAWRADRLENALDAFFAREDFRDYYKLAGWDGYLAFRPLRNMELRFDWRSDHYESLAQNVFYGRFGGNKVLPPNPPVGEGEMHSLAITAQNEHAHTRRLTVRNIFGDSVEIEQLAGSSSLAQVELGHMPGSDFGFNRYLLDLRKFHPFFHGISYDVRFRFEATTGDLLQQKMEFLGGPSSLPALYRKSIEGNRMLLLNTEVRLNLNMLSSFFNSPDLNLVVYNDFAKMGMAGDGESIVQGFQFSGASSILYNVGVGIGWTNGIQLGASWRTDVKADPRVIFRLQRPF